LTKTPDEPTFRGVENEQWARYAGTGGGLRFLTALPDRRKQRGNARLPPFLPVMIARAAFTVVVLGLTLVIMWALRGS
jgi:hypothetical protein